MKVALPRSPARQEYAQGPLLPRLTFKVILKTKAGTALMKELVQISYNMMYIVTISKWKVEFFECRENVLWLLDASWRDPEVQGYDNLPLKGIWDWYSRLTCKLWKAWSIIPAIHAQNQSRQTPGLKRQCRWKTWFFLHIPVVKSI